MRKYQETGYAAKLSGTSAATTPSTLEIIEAEPAEPLRVFVVIGGGVVEAVYCTDETAQVEIIDHDGGTMGGDEQRRQYAEARDLLAELYEAQAAHMVY